MNSAEPMPVTSQCLLLSTFARREPGSAWLHSARSRTCGPRRSAAPACGQTPMVLQSWADCGNWHAQDGRPAITNLGLSLAQARQEYAGVPAGLRRRR